MACSSREISRTATSSKRKRSQVSELLAIKRSQGPQLSEETISAWDAFAFTLTRQTTLKEERAGCPEKDHYDRVSSSLAPTKPAQTPAEDDGTHERAASSTCTGLAPPLNRSSEKDVPDFGEAIPGACDALLDIALKLVAQLDGLTFKAPVSCVYNPLVYAHNLYSQYIQKHGGRRVEVLLVGMNPGPFGMAQTGVPFGDSTFVRTFLGLSGQVKTPEFLHPKRPILGLTCQRSEVSGQRLWGWAQGKFGCAASFFNRFWVYNYCPLVFMEASGKNRTPDKLHPSERAKLEEACNWALIKTVSVLRPVFVVGVGKYAALKIQNCGIRGVKVGDIMHPSPANPLANKDWGKKVEEQLGKLGLALGT